MVRSDSIEEDSGSLGERGHFRGGEIGDRDDIGSRARRIERLQVVDQRL